jgi:hypothetical protein
MRLSPLSGTVTLERFEAGHAVETVNQDPEDWKLIYFNHAPR